MCDFRNQGHPTTILWNWFINVGIKTSNVNNKIPTNFGSWRGSPRDTEAMISWPSLLLNTQDYCSICNEVAEASVTP